MMTKLTALISTLALLLTLCACSGQAEVAESHSIPPEPETVSQAVSETPTRDVPPSEEPEPSAAPAEETEPPAPSEEPQPSDAAPETSAPTPESAAVPEPTPTPAPPSTPEPTPTPAPPPPTQEPTPEPPPADLKTIAEGLIGHPVSELYAAIGQPLASDYAPGCIEPNSEDGELIYSGFTVYTVRTATREYVYDVL